jgi:hypothetical protein
MTTIAELRQLTTELTEHAPPPEHPIGVNFPLLPNTGKWVVERIEYGGYAIRAQYLNELRQEVTLSVDGEMRGSPQSLAVALRFSIQIAKSSRLHWYKVG